MATQTINIGLLGCGVVGGGLVTLIQRNADRIAAHSGVHINVRRALVRQLDKPRGIPLTQNAQDIVAADDVDLVVEVMGGVDDAERYVTAALRHGKHVVTANKALLATRGQALFALAAAQQRHLGFEASVCGGIPIIGALKQGLAGNRIAGLCGIVNGTTNFILSQMTRFGASAPQALAEARARGFCEADASFDLDGIDAAQKLVLLARLAFGVEAELSDVQCQGMSHIEAEDVRQAAALGYVIKHLVQARSLDNGRCDLQVLPSLVPQDHPLAAVNDEHNAVLLAADAVGDMVFVGKGAGAGPTASAVLADICEIAQRRDGAPRQPTLQRAIAAAAHTRPARRFYLRLPIADEAGVIGRITTALGAHGVSIEHASAALTHGASSGSVVIVVHHTSEAAVQAAVQALPAADLRGKPVVLSLFEQEAAAQPQSQAAPRTPLESPNLLRKIGVRSSSLNTNERTASTPAV